MIKAVFIDIDETLTNSKKEVTLKTKNEIRRCVEKGIKIILTSGRSRMEAIEYQERIGASPYIISSNGASCYDRINNKEIYSKPIRRDSMDKLLEYVVKNKYKIKLNYRDELALNIASYPDEEDKIKTIRELKEIIENEQIVQCVISNEEIEKMLAFKIYLEKDNKELKITNESKRFKNPSIKPSNIYYCDITSKDVSKGNAVMAICEYLNLEKEEIITIGDGENDISMLALTPNSIAMGNALECVKSIVQYETLTNDEDGVAKILERL